jgi:hypothetical protein
MAGLFLMKITPKFENGSIMQNDEAKGAKNWQRMVLAGITIILPESAG